MNLVEAFKFRNCEVATRKGKLSNNKQIKVNILKDVSPKCVNSKGELFLPSVDIVAFDALINVKGIVKKIYIPKTVKIIDKEGYLYPFSYIDNLEQIEVSEENNIFYCDKGYVYKNLLQYENQISVLTMPTKEDLKFCDKQNIELIFDSTKNSVYKSPENFDQLIINNGAFFSNNRIKSANLKLKENAVVKINPARDLSYTTINDILINNNPIKLVDFVTKGALVSEISNVNNVPQITYLPITENFEELFINSNKKTISYNQINNAKKQK